jgi:lysyl-tRNA synthetase class 2
MYRALRQFFQSRGYQEVETPALVPMPGMEPHIDAFSVSYVPEMEVTPARRLYLHTSPEYAMKRLLAMGSGPIFQICKVFRNGELSPAHNPEFTLLEFYRTDADYRRIMEDLEQALNEVERAVGRGGPLSRVPYQRLTVREAVLRHAGVNLEHCPDAASLRVAAQTAGIALPNAGSFEDAFFRLFLQKVEPELGQERPTYLIDYPAAMASLARLKPGDASVAERFELYVRGAELANGFSELTDATEQRRRLVEEQALRRAAGKPVYHLDEEFLAAVGQLPPCAGVAVGLDRVLMLLLGASSIAEVLLFPGREFL